MEWLSRENASARRRSSGRQACWHPRREHGSRPQRIAPVAIEQGRYIASLIKERMAGQETKPFHYRNRTNLATVGRSWGIVDKGKLQLTGWLAWLYWLAIHIVRLIGFRNRSIVLFQWAWAYLTFQRGARLILHESKIHDLMVP